jgi:hypothetical protein
MHEAELMGYPKKALTPQAHSFMDERRAAAIDLAKKANLGGTDNWHTGNAQAAAWTANKIRRGDISPEDAAKHFGDYIDQFNVNATYELTPGRTTGHLAGVEAGDAGVRAGFAADPRGSWMVPETGTDAIYNASQALPETTVKGVGRFKGETNPAFVARPLAGVDITPTGQVMQKGTENMLNAGEAFRGYVDAQDAGAWHKIMKSKEPGYTGATIRMGGPAGEDATMEAAKRLESKGLYLASSPEGLTVIPGEGAQTGGARAKMLRSEVKQIPGVQGVDMGAAKTGYIDYSGNWPKGKGAVTMQMLDEVQKSPQMMKALENDQRIPGMLMARNERDLEASAQGLGVAREDILTARKIFAEAPAGQRFAALLDAAKKGIVPAVLLSSLAKLGAGQSETD